MGIGYSKSLLIPIVAIFVLTIGIISEPQNAYAGLNGNGNGEDHGMVIEIHCEVEYFWVGELVEVPETEDVNFEGERGESEGECLYEFEDGFFDEVAVFVVGEFLLTSLTLTEGGVMDIEGTFHIEDFDGNAVWVEETGTITLEFCDEEHEAFEIEGIPICIETTGTVIDGKGIFEVFTGSYESEGFGFITDFIEGFSFRTVWVFFDEPNNAIWCEVFGDWDSGSGFWKNGGDDSEFIAEGECQIIRDFEELVVDVEIVGGFLVEEIEDDCKDVETELTIFIDDKGFEGTIEAVASSYNTEGEICRNHDTVSSQDIEITGGTGDFSNIVGGEGSFTSVMHNRGGFFEAEIHATLEASGHTHYIGHPEVSGGGKGCSGECNPPTMGLNKAGDFRLVDKGFNCNGQEVDVLHFYTPFPKIENKVGEPLRCTFKIYEDSGADKIRHFEFAVGKKFGSAMSDEQGKIVWDRTFKGEESVTYDENLFRDVSVKAMGLTKCREVSNSANCLLLSLSATPKEPLVDDIIVKTNIWDHRRNAKQNTHNEGIDFVGMTENPLPHYLVVDGRNGITAIFTTDYSLQDLDHAIDKYGNTWTKINNIWHKDYVMPDLSCTRATYLGYDRYCPEFNLMKQGQGEMGKQFFDSSKIQSELTEPFAYEFPERDNNRLAGTQLGI